MDIKLFFEEMYQSQIDGALTQYVQDHWIEALRFLSNDHEAMDFVIQIANQSIKADRKEIYDGYVNNLLVGKGVKV